MPRSPFIRCRLKQALSRDLEKVVWDSLSTEPGQVAYASLRPSWQSTDEIADGFKSRTGYPIKLDTIESYLQGFKKEGLVNQQPRAPPETTSEWQPTSDGQLVQPIAFWLIKYAAERNTSTAKYLGRESPYEALKILESITTDTPSEEVKEVLAQSNRSVRRHFRNLQERGIIDLSKTTPQYNLDDVGRFMAEAVAPVQRYLSDGNVQKMSYPMELFSEHDFVAKLCQSKAVELYLQKGSGLEGSVEFGKWLRGMREEKKIGLREFARQIRYSPAYISDVENGHVKISDKVINAAAKFFGMNGEILSWLTTPSKRGIRDVLRENPESVATLLSFGLKKY